MGVSCMRLGDNSAGHGCFGPTPAISGSHNVFINSRASVRQTDQFETHCCVICHSDRRAASGSSKVFVNSLPIFRIGDSISCGDVGGQGSNNVFAGG